MIKKLKEEAFPKPCALAHSQLVLGQAQKTWDKETGKK
jgi:hypothetical protein